MNSFNSTCSFLYTELLIYFLLFYISSTLVVSENVFSMVNWQNELATQLERFLAAYPLIESFVPDPFCASLEIENGTIHGDRMLL